MDLSDPTRSVTATLDGPILAVLAAAGKPLTVGDIAREAARGSEIGIRRSLARLVEQGTVRATLMGRNQVHELNRDHVAAPIADLLAGLRNELWKRLRDELCSWRPTPLYACVFGSAARGDGDDASDIDLLLVHPPFPGEKKPARLSPSLRSLFADALGGGILGTSEADPAPLWEAQIDRVRELVKAWTGNEVQIVDLSFFEWRHPPESYLSLFDDIREHGHPLVRARGLSLWPTGATPDG
jgi:predicted nucleotidyltransferase